MKGANMKCFQITDDCGWIHTITTERDITAAEIEALTPHVRHAVEVDMTNGDKIRSSENAVMTERLTGFCPYHGSGKKQCGSHASCTECRADWLDRRADGD